MNIIFGDTSILQSIDVGLLAIAVLGGAIRVGTPFLFVRSEEHTSELQSPSASASRNGPAASTSAWKVRSSWGR